MFIYNNYTAMHNKSGANVKYLPIIFDLYWIDSFAPFQIRTLGSF